MKNLKRLACYLLISLSVIACEKEEILPEPQENGTEVMGAASETTVLTTIPDSTTANDTVWHPYANFDSCFAMTLMLMDANGNIRPFGQNNVTGTAEILVSQTTLKVRVRTNAGWYFSGLRAKVAQDPNLLSVSQMYQTTTAITWTDHYLYLPRPTGDRLALWIEVDAKKLNLYGTSIVWSGPMSASNKTSLSGTSKWIEIQFIGCCWQVTGSETIPSNQ